MSDIVVHPRSAWTAVLPANAGVDIADEIDSLPNFQVPEVTGITVHWTGSSRDFHYRDPIPVFEGIRYNDMTNKKYSDIMYNLGVSGYQAGVWALRGLINKGAAQGREGNTVDVSILCLVGTQEGANDLLLQNLRDARKLVVAKYPTAVNVNPHHYWRATECPGDELTEIIANPDFWVDEEPPVTEEPYVCPLPLPSLTEGDRNMRVLLLQDQLHFWGYYNATSDGYYGNITRWGVAVLQNDLKKWGYYPYNVDGFYGPKTHEGWCKHLEALWGLTH